MALQELARAEALHGLATVLSVPAAWLVLILLLALAAALARVAPRLAREARPSRRSNALLAAAVVVAALARLPAWGRAGLLSDEMIFQETARSLLVERAPRVCLVGRAGECRVGAYLKSMKLAHSIVLAAGQMALGWSDLASQATALLVGVLAVPAAFWAGRLLLGREEDGLAAAAILAVLPLHASLSRTLMAETTSVLAVLVAASLVALYSRGRRPSELAAASLALMASVFIRIENALLAVPLLWALSRSGTPLSHRALGLALAALMAVPGALWLSTEGTEGVPPRGARDLAPLNTYTAVQYWAGRGHHSPLLTLLALAGAASIWRSDRRLSAALLAWFLVYQALFVMEPFYLGLYGHDRRMLSSYVPFVLLAARGLVDASGRLGMRLGPAASPAALAVLAAATLPLLGPQPCTEDMCLEERFGREFAREHVPDRCWVATAVPVTVNGLWGRRAIDVRYADVVEERLRQGDCVLFYNEYVCRDDWGLDSEAARLCQAVLSRYERALLFDDQRSHVEVYELRPPRPSPSGSAGAPRSL